MKRSILRTVDPDIQNLVAALNDAGYETWSSCEGHMTPQFKQLASGRYVAPHGLDVFHPGYIAFRYKLSVRDKQVISSMVRTFLPEVHFKFVTDYNEYHKFFTRLNFLKPVTTKKPTVTPNTACEIVAGLHSRSQIYDPKTAGTLVSKYDLSQDELVKIAKRELDLPITPVADEKFLKRCETYIHQSPGYEKGSA